MFGSISANYLECLALVEWNDLIKCQGMVFASGMTIATRTIWTSQFHPNFTFSKPITNIAFMERVL